MLWFISTANTATIVSTNRSRAVDVFKPLEMYGGLMAEKDKSKSSTRVSTIWKMAIGLQALDLLDVSETTDELARMCESGEISPADTPAIALERHGNSTEGEADVVAARMVADMAEIFCPQPDSIALSDLHMRLFEGFDANAGVYRTAPEMDDWPDASWFSPSGEPVGDSTADGSSMAIRVDRVFTWANEKISEMSAHPDTKPDLEKAAEIVESACSSIVAMRPFARGNARVMPVMGAIWSRSIAKKKKKKG